MSVHYKFKSALEYDTVTFDGLHISVKDLKKAILQQKKIGKTLDFDLQVTNAQTKETYTDENVLIPKNASLIIARVPLTQQQKKQFEKEKLAAAGKAGETTEQSTLGQVDIASLNLSEEEKIKTMISQSTSDYDPSNYVKVRGGNQIGTVPASYICFKCHQHGHWIKDCPSTVDSANMGMTDTIRKSTGIPRSFMIEVEGPQVPGARMTPSGVYAVPAIDHEVYKEKKIEKPPFLAEKEKPPPATTIPEDLICGICKDLLQDAVMIPCCGISFCDECIRNVLVDSEESECPDCNEKNVSPDTMIPNRFLRNSVNTFKNKTGYVKSKPKLIQQRPPSPPRPSLPDFVPPPEMQGNQTAVKTEANLKEEPVSKGHDTPKDSFSMKTESKDSSGKTEGKEEKNSLKAEKDSSKAEKLKKSGIDMDDVSSVSSNASEEPPPPVEKRQPKEGASNPSQGPSYAIPSLFSGQHPVILPPPGSEPYPPPRLGDGFGHSGPVGERSGTPTVDERLDGPPVRGPYDPYRPPNSGYMVPGYDPHYGMHPMSMPYDSNMMYDRGYRGMPRGLRMPRGRYAMRQPPPPGSRPLSPPRNEEEAYLAFQRMLKEKEERDKRKNEKLKSRRTTSRSRSRSTARSRRSFSGARSRTPSRRSRSRSKKRSRTRSRSFMMSRSRSRSYSRSPLHERNYSPKKYYSPHRSPPRQDRYDSAYGQWGQDNRDYRRGRYRGRGRGRLYKNSPPRSHDQQLYNSAHQPQKLKPASEKTQRRTAAKINSLKTQNINIKYRYRDENFVSASPKHYRSPSRYYDHRMSPRAGDYPRDSREREYRSYDRDTESAARDRDRNRRRSHSNSLARNQYESERERERDRDKEKDRHRETDYRRRSRSRRSRSRRYTPVSKAPQERNGRSKDKSPERSKDWEKEKNGRHRSRDRRSYEEEKDKRKYTSDRDRSKDVDRDKRRGRTRSRSRDKARHEKDRSRSKDKKKSSPSRGKRKTTETSKKRRSSSRHRSNSRVKEERSHSPDRSNKEHKKRSDTPEKSKEKRSISKQREEITRSSSKETVRDEKASSPKVLDKDDDDKKEKKKDKDKKKRKKEKETDEERAARKKKKKEKKEEKKRKQEIKESEFRKNEETENNEDEAEEEPKSAPKVIIPPNPNFVSSFRAVVSDEDIKAAEKKNESKGERKSEEKYIEPSKDHEKGSVKTTEDRNVKEYKKSLSEGHNPEETEAEASLEDDNIELQIHASYESLLEETGDNQKKGILASVPEKSKWELDENQAPDSNPKTSSSDAKSPEFPAKVTREVIKRAENAIFKKAVNAIREPAKKSYDKEERKDRKVILAPDKERSKDHNRLDIEGEKVKRVFLTRDKDKFHYGSLEVGKSKPELKRALNSLHITIPLNSDGGTEREISVGEEGTREKQNLLQKKSKNSSRSPPTGRVPVKERLGSKIEKQGRHSSPQVIRTAEKRSRNADEEDSKPSRKEYQRPALSSTIESIDAKRSSIDEAHFVPNYDESSDEEENVKVRHGNDKEARSGEAKKRLRSSSESSDESIKKRKKKRSKSKKKKTKRSKKHVSDSSDSSDSDREKKKHKKSKKKKKSKH